MELLLLDIVRTLRENPYLDARGLGHIINKHSNRLPGDTRFAKKQLMPYYLRVRENEPERWESWDIDEQTEKRLLKLIQMKPRRTASGVATITVITKPWTCTGNCLFCPADVRMPKSYLHAEPACQRAERNWFDPYLQVSARLHVLQQMGHATDKVEIIVLGGTFDDYPREYRIWFMEEVFRALNGAAAEADDRGTTPCGLALERKQESWRDSIAQRSARYRIAGIANAAGSSLSRDPVLLCGIADPARFASDVAASGVRAARTVALRDHDRRLRRTLEVLLRDGEQVVITEKDFARLPAKFQNESAVFIARQQVHVSESAKKALIAACGSPRR